MKKTMKANKYLDQQAEALAERHAERLNSMRQKAMGHYRRPWLLNPFLLAGVPASALALLLVSLWPATMQTLDSSLPVQATADISTSVPAAIPAWVADTQVPVEVLENIEFYEWLSHELTNKKQS